MTLRFCLSTSSFILISSLVKIGILGCIIGFSSGSLARQKCLLALRHYNYKYQLPLIDPRDRIML